MPVQQWATIEVQQLSEAQRKLGITAGGVPATRIIGTTAPLVGGGDLSIDRTHSIPKATAAVDGYLSAADFVVFSSKENSLTFNGPLSRVVDTVSIPAATAAVDGYLSAANFVIFAAKVSASRAINTSAPLTGGGDLSADRTLSMPASTNAADGYLTSADHTTFAAKESALTFSAPLARAVNTVSIPVATGAANGYLSSADWTTFSAKVSAARLINTTSPLLGGGTLAADLSLTLDFTVSWTWTANGIAATPTDRIVLSNTTAAISGTQQYSPALRFTGQGFKTDATTGSKSTDWRIYSQPVQAAGNPTANLLFQFSVDGGAFSTQTTISSGGTYTIAGSMITGASTGSGISFSTRSVVTSPSDGVIRLTNQAASDFTRLQFGSTGATRPGLGLSGVNLLVQGADGTAVANLGIGTAAPGTSFSNGIYFGTTQGTSPSTSVDLVHLYGLDISAGHRSLAIWSEEVTNAAVGVASTHRLPVTINGVQYAILLTTVLA